MLLIAIIIIITGLSIHHARPHPHHHHHDHYHLQVSFLEYIRQWRKKVVFVINKADMLGGSSEVEQVRNFVSANAQRVLGLDEPIVLAVSSRK